MKLIPIDLFNIDVAVFTSDKDRVKALRAEGCNPDKHDPSALSSAHIDTSDDGSPRFSMVIKPRARKEVWAHECCHMADFICDVFGIPVTVENGEIRAYLVQHIFGGIERALEPGK